jgi:hypothetical protein
MSGMNNFVAGYAVGPVANGNIEGVFVSTSNPEVWSHEIGHYFGLPHTHHGFQYVNSPVVILGESYSCYQTGDGFCDTPADFDDCALQGSANCIPFTCSYTDPLGVNFQPDPTLLMSYYEGGCRNRFSAEQKQFMRTLYLLHPAYEPIRNPHPDCIQLKYGLIERECVDPQNSLTSFEPMVGVDIRIDNLNQDCNTETDQFGRYVIEPCSLFSSLRRVIPSKNYLTPLAGVTTFDLVLLQQFITGNKPFTAYQKIGADANNSGSVTTFDLVTLQRMILGVIPNVPAGSWRYVPRLATSTPGFFLQFDDGNPFDAVLSDPITFGFQRYYLTSQGGIPNNDSWMDFVRLDKSSPLTQSIDAWSFVGVKVGDFNCSADVDSGSPEPVEEPVLETEPGGVYALSAGQSKRFQIKALTTEPVLAWQFGVVYSDSLLTVTAVHNGNTGAILGADNYHVGTGTTNSSEGVMNVLWYSTDDNPIDLDGKILCEFDVVGNSTVALDTVFSLSNKNVPFQFYDHEGVAIEGTELILVPVTDSTEIREHRGETPPGNSTEGIVSVYPVPFKSKFFWETNFGKNTEIEISLFSVYGSLVFERTLEVRKGRDEIVVDGLEILAPGFYYYLIDTDSGRFQGKILKR